MEIVDDDVENSPDKFGGIGEYYEEDLREFNIDQLRNTFKLFGLVVPPPDVTDKDELIGLLMNSGKISKTPESYGED